MVLQAGVLFAPGLFPEVPYHLYLDHTRAIAERYEAAHAFLFPTGRDIWGLVLVEAMAAARACVASVHAGATRDLIADGATGYAVDFEKTDLVAYLRTL